MLLAGPSLSESQLMSSRPIVLPTGSQKLPPGGRVSRLCQTRLILQRRAPFGGLMVLYGLCFILCSFEAANVTKCQSKDQLSLSLSFQDI